MSYEIRISTAHELVVLIALLKGEYDELKDLELHLQSSTDSLQDSIQNAEKEKEEKNAITYPRQS